MIRHVVATAVLVLVAVTASAGQETSTAPTIDYDTFMQMDAQGRIRTFNQITPENRAEVVRTHIERWLEKNRSRLNAEQIKVMEENIAFVTADVYRRPREPQKMEQAKALEAKTAALLSRSDMSEALTIHGAHIPKKQ